MHKCNQENAVTLVRIHGRIVKREDENEEGREATIEDLIKLREDEGEDE